jgi:hypothetical protein
VSPRQIDVSGHLLSGLQDRDGTVSELRMAGTLLSPGHADRAAIAVDPGTVGIASRSEPWPAAAVSDGTERHIWMRASELRGGSASDLVSVLSDVPEELQYVLAGHVRLPLGGQLR